MMSYSDPAPSSDENAYPNAVSRYAMNASGCAIARSIAPFALRRSHGGFDHSSVSFGFRLSQTDRPHCGQYLSSRFLRSDVPQRKHGFSRARGSDVNCLTYTSLPPSDGEDFSE